LTTVCVHQPDFLPWLGFFHRLKNCDVFVVLDNVQFIRRGWQHRDKIKTARGPQWLTVPVKKKGRFDQLIREVEIDDSTDWRGNHMKTLESAYGRAPHFTDVFPAVRGIYAKRHSHLMDLNMDFIRFFCEAFGIDVDTRFASGMDVAGNKSELLAGLTVEAGGQAYLTGTGSRDYLDEGVFESAGIRVRWQEFKHPEYPQLHGNFAPALSAIDALFNCGDGCRDHLAR
jgi:hypothetical protein